MVTSILFEALSVVFGIVAICAFVLFAFSGMDSGGLLCFFVAGLILCLVFVGCATIHEQKNTTSETVVMEAIVEDKQISSVKLAQGSTEDQYHITLDFGDNVFVTTRVTKAEYDSVRKNTVVMVEKTIKTVFGEKQEPTYQLVLEETTS